MIKMYCSMILQGIAFIDTLGMILSDACVCPIDTSWTKILGALWRKDRALERTLPWHFYFRLMVMIIVMGSVIGILAEQVMKLAIGSFTWLVVRTIISYITQPFNIFVYGIKGYIFFTKVTPHLKTWPMVGCMGGVWSFQLAADQLQQSHSWDEGGLQLFQHWVCFNIWLTKYNLHVY